MGRRSNKRLRVRTKRLDQLDETKLALALWLMAKDALVAERPIADEAHVILSDAPTDEDGAEAA
jgi:hypothetical protein